MPQLRRGHVCPLSGDMVGVIHCRSQGLPHSTLTEARLTRRGPLSLAATRLLPADRRGPSHSPRPAVTRRGLLLPTEARVTRRATARDPPRPESLRPCPGPSHLLLLVTAASFNRGPSH